MVKNIPIFLYNKLCEQYGEELTKKIIEGYTKKRAVTLRMNTLKDTRARCTVPLHSTN